MPKIIKVATGVLVSALQGALDVNEHLWDENTGRTSDPASPHHELSDIWVRYAQQGVDDSQAHKAAWYPCADLLPVRELVYPLMGLVEGDELGGVLITRIPPGGTCRPHVDNGWHACYYQKFAIQIKADPGQAFQFEGESLVTAPGDLYWFDNSHSHWVTNPTEAERITMIVCIKTNIMDWAR